MQEPAMKVNDELYCASMSYLRNMMDFLVLNDIVKAGDVTRVVPMLKHLAPTFVGLTSLRSKYAIECINMVAKLNVALSEKEKTKVLLQAFVNTTGQPGRNKAADMQQENNIKTVKTIFKGMGAGKTDSALIRASKAAPAVSRMAAQFEHDFNIKVPKARLESYKKKSADDRTTIRDIFANIVPFKITDGRTIGKSVPASPLATVDVNAFSVFVRRNADRAIDQADLDV
eukprot:GHVO01055077.1.p1 GENE.GHVO01055077.1~~GHVO01055077.1.p1  ORF type:complete len:229 (-),score=22.24 GHVO01055077.1:43-729(-)